MTERRKRERPSARASLPEWAESPPRVIRKARRNLAIAVMGAADFVAGTDELRAEVGLSNAIVYGKSALDVLGKLARFKLTGFDEWWRETNLLLRSDPLMSWFIASRSSILKTGDHPRLFNQVRADRLADALIEIFGEPPSDSDMFFIGPDGMGWTTKQPDGSVTRTFVESTPEIDAKYEIEQVFDDGPREHMGQAIPDSPRDQLELFLGQVAHLINEASEQFASETSCDAES